MAHNIGASVLCAFLFAFFAGFWLSGELESLIICNQCRFTVFEVISQDGYFPGNFNRISLVVFGQTRLTFSDGAMELAGAERGHGANDE